MHVKSCNVLGAEDIYRLFSLPQLSEDNSVSFTTRLLFRTALKTALRPSKIHLLQLIQVSEGVYNYLKCIRVNSRLCSVNGTVKQLRVDGETLK